MPVGPVQHGPVAPVLPGFPVGPESPVGPVQQGPVGPVGPLLSFLDGSDLQTMTPAQPGSQLSLSLVVISLLNGEGLAPRFTPPKVGRDQLSFRVSRHWNPGRRLRVLTG